MSDCENMSSNDSTDGVMYFAKRPFATMPEKKPTSDDDSDSDDSMDWKKRRKLNNKKGRILLDK